MSIHPVAIYSIKNGAELASIAEGDGSGTLEEGHLWVAGVRHLEAARDAGEALALLLGDASTTRGIEWVALVDEIELVDDKRTLVHFSLLAPLPEPVSLDRVWKESDGQLLGANYIRGYVPCELPSEVEPYASQLAHANSERWPAQVYVARLPASRFVDAVDALSGAWSQAYRTMLLGHARAPRHTLSILEVARLAGYADYDTGNLQYGTLAGQFKRRLGAEGVGQNLQAISYCPPQKNEVGHNQFRLRPQLVYALRKAGFIETDSGADDPDVNDDLLGVSRKHAAEQTLAAEPEFNSADETTRTALVDARVGQGTYRRQLLALWDGRCAVTGLTLKEALVASHAKPWAESSNRERLDPYNGLLLAASVDRLFEVGLISFGSDGRLLLKSSVGATDLARVGLSHESQLRLLHEQHQTYLAAHRQRHGFEQ